MAHYALLNNENFVTSVISGADEYYIINGLDTETNYSNLYNCIAKRTSYNTHGGIHYQADNNTPSQDQSKAFRKNYAGIGYYYDSIRDAFIPPKPFPSWTLNEQTCLWQSPIPYPNDGKVYTWNEEIGNWEEINLTR
jgi:hypothetical protein